MMMMMVMRLTMKKPCGQAVKLAYQNQCYRSPWHGYKSHSDKS